MGDLRVVLLAGGSGQRFWPASRPGRPKQVLALAGGEPLVTRTLARVAPLVPTSRVAVVAAAALRAPLLAAAPALGEATWWEEPLPRGTLGAVALAVARSAPQDVLVFLPCDHHYRDDTAFREALREAVLRAAQGGIGLLGVPPTRPETGFGYLEVGAAVGRARPVLAFREKPDRAEAERLLARGDCWWNAGLFVAQARVFALALEQTQPEVWAAVQRGADWASLPTQSFDHAVLERLDPAGPVERWALPLEAGFSDLGHWGALEDLAAPDAAGNVALGEVDLLECTNVLAYAEDGRIAALGLEGLIVVRSGSHVLVCPRSRAQEVRRLAERAGQEGG